MRKIKQNNNSRRIRSRKTNIKAIHGRAINFLRSSDISNKTK